MNNCFILNYITQAFRKEQEKKTKPGTVKSKCSKLIILEKVHFQIGY